MGEAGGGGGCAGSGGGAAGPADAGGYAGPVAPAPKCVEVPGELQLAELDDAAPAELEMVLAEFEEPASPESSFDSPDLEGLDMSQVESALRSWEES